jgi:hypothetical protein
VRFSNNTNRDTLERTGPGIWTDLLLQRSHSQGQTLAADDPWGVRILPRVAFGAHPSGVDGVDPHAPGVYALHHFMGSWKKTGGWQQSTGIQKLLAKLTLPWTASRAQGATSATAASTMAAVGATGAGLEGAGAEVKAAAAAAAAAAAGGGAELSPGSQDAMMVAAAQAAAQAAAAGEDPVNAAAAVLEEHPTAVAIAEALHGAAASAAQAVTTITSGQQGDGNAAATVERADPHHVDHHFTVEHPQDAGWHFNTPDAKPELIKEMVTDLFPVSAVFDPPFDVMVLLLGEDGPADRSASGSAPFKSMSSSLTNWGSYHPGVHPSRRPGLAEALVGSLGGHKRSAVLVRRPPPLSLARSLNALSSNGPGEMCARRLLPPPFPPPLCPPP